MSILDLMVDLRAATTEADRDAAHARFQERKRAQPTLGEQVTAVLRNSTTPDGKPFLQADEHADIENGKVVVKKLS
ncbi:hypothetical protein [Burkholderia pseudomallei]|uniref:hypothetical protein n=1 Tax=Burkholderia pseudomallei TaxID=28450 RepID=UPI000A1A1500|nr:hypothetical protein [Burkholderia pseudomallei]ARL04269.1 hypothetical protein BOC44_21095 [Burkholderia pseudomallei]